MYQQQIIIVFLIYRTRFFYNMTFNLFYELFNKNYFCRLDQWKVKWLKWGSLLHHCWLQKNSLLLSQIHYFPVKWVFLNYSFDEATEISLRHPVDAKLPKEGNCQLSKYNKLIKAKELMSSSYSWSFFWGCYHFW